MYSYYVYTSPLKTLHLEKTQDPPRRSSQAFRCPRASSPSTSSTTNSRTHHDLPESTQRRRSNSNPPIHPSPQTINPPTLKHIPLHPPPAQPHQLPHPNKTSYLTLTHQNTDTPHNHVTTPPHRGRVGPSPSKGVATTSNTTTQNKKTETSQPTPRRKSGVRGVGSL